MAMSGTGPPDVVDALLTEAPDDLGSCRSVQHANPGRETCCPIYENGKRYEPELITKIGLRRRYPDYTFNGILKESR